MFKNCSKRAISAKNSTSKHMINKNYFQSSDFKNYDFQSKTASVSHFVIIFASKIAIFASKVANFDLE